jgi:hypothetical protein
VTLHDVPTPAGASTSVGRLRTRRGAHILGDLAVPVLEAVLEVAAAAQVLEAAAQVG